MSRWQHKVKQYASPACGSLIPRQSFTMVILAEKQQIPAIYAFKSMLTLEQIVLWCVSWVLTESEWHDGKILTKAQKGDCSSLIAGVWRVFLSSSLFLLLLLYSCNSHHKAASGCLMVAELLAPWLVLHLRDTEKCVLGASFFFFLFSFFSLLVHVGCFTLPYKPAHLCVLCWCGAQQELKGLTGL